MEKGGKEEEEEGQEEDDDDEEEDISSSSISLEAYSSSISSLELNERNMIRLTLLLHATRRG